MGDGTDFASYLVARWPALVRTLVLIGCPPAEVDGVAQVGLAPCYASWDRMRREDDVDAHVYRAVLDAWSRHRRGRGSPVAAVAAPLVLDPTVADPEERLALLAALTARLDLLTDEDRARLVLRFVAELDDAQVADVLEPTTYVDIERVTAQFREADLREVIQAIPVGQPPIDEVVALAGTRRRRRLTWTAGIVAGVVAVVGIGTWLGTRPPDDGLPGVVVTQEENPAGVAWYANRVLHLPHVSLELPQLEDLVEMPDGVVFGDTDERVVFADGEGELTALGRKVAGTPVVGSSGRGWVAWLEPGAPSPELVAYDTRDREELARRPAPAGSRPVAIDLDRLYFATPDGDFTWRLPDGEPQRLYGGTGELADVASQVRVRQNSSDQIRITQPVIGIDHTLTGRGGLLSPDGRYVLTHVDDPVPGVVRIYDAATGSAVETGLSLEDVALAAAFGPNVGSDHTVFFVVAHRDNAPAGNQFLRLSTSGPHLLRVCDLEQATCETLTQFAHNRGTPVLPAD